MTDTTTTGKKEFTIIRVFDASRETLWNAWTDPGEAEHWLHPRGLISPRELISFDVREGGRFEYTMVNEENGDRYPTGGTYLEVVRPERLVFTWGDPDDAGAPIATVTLEEVAGESEGESAGDRTRMTFRLAGVDGAPGDDFFYDGWASALDLLLERISA